MDVPDSSGGVNGDDETQYLTPTASDPNAETFGLTQGDATLDLSNDFRIGPYRVLRELGRGGMGIVYLAEDPELKRLVALKVLPPAFGNHSAHIARFKREAEVASRLDHPNLCGVLRVGQSEGRHWIAMRYVKGQPLDEKLRQEESLSRQATAVATKSVARRESKLAAKLQMIEKVSRALQVAHDAGVVHRDLKPGNIIVTEDGEPVVLDFGLAIDLQNDDGPALTQSGDVLGTPYYMAPEQIRGEAKSADHRVDVWAMGVMLYEVITGQRPFAGATRDALYRAILESEPTALKKLVPSAPKDLATIIETALSKSIDKRYASAGALADDLRALMEIRPIHARPVGVTEKAIKLARRKPALATLILAMVIAVPTLAVLLTNSALDQRRIDAALSRNREQVVEELRKGRPRAARAALFAGRSVAEDRNWESKFEAQITALEEDEEARTILLDDDADPKGVRAVAYLKSLVASRPADEAPRVWLALAYAKQGLEGEAAKELKQLQNHAAYIEIFESKGVREKPDTHKTGLLGLFEVVLLSIRERPNEALTRLEVLMEESPSESALAWVAAEQATKLQNFRGALAYASKAKSLMSELSTLQLGRYSVHLRRAGHPEMALEMARTAFERAPKDTLLRIHYAAALADSNRVEESIEVYRSLLRDAPDSAVAHRSFVSVLIERQEFDEALVVSRRAVALDQDNADVYVNHAAILEGLDDLDGTLEALDTALKLRPKFPFALHNRASCLKDLERYEEALTSAREALELRPIYPECHFTIASTYLKQGKDEEALLALNDAISQKADFSDALSGAATVHLRAGRFEEALSFYQRALAVVPTDYLAWMHLPLVYEALGRMEDALKAGANSMRYHPTQIQGGLNYGSAMIHAKKLDEALVLFWELFDLSAEEDRISLIMVTLLAERDLELSTSFLLRLEGRESPFLKHIAQFLPVLVDASAANKGDSPIATVCRLRKEIDANGSTEDTQKQVRELFAAHKKVPLAENGQARITNLATSHSIARLAKKLALADLEQEAIEEVKRREDAYAAAAKIVGKRREKEAQVERDKVLNVRTK